METTANQLKGRAIGALFFTGFGTLWLTLALYLRQSLNIGVMAGISVGLMVLLSGIAWLFSVAGRFPKVAEDPARSKAFRRINSLQWIAVGLVSFLFGHFHLDAYVVSAITAIVAIHMFPLAKLFRYPMHYLTGGLLVVWATASVLVLPLDQMQGLTAIGTGSILWLSAAITVAMALTIALRSRSTSALHG